MMTDMDSEDDDILLEGMMDDLDGLLDTTGEDEILDGGELDSDLADAMAEAAAFLEEGEEEKTLEQTLQTMESTQLCVHPAHSHSFAKVTFTLGASLRKCAGCQQGFKSVFSGTDGAAAEPADASIVKCVACGALAHRSCALSSTVTWAEPCPINAPKVVTAVPPPAAAPPPPPPPVVTDNEEEMFDKEAAGAEEQEPQAEAQPEEEEEEEMEFTLDLETKLSTDEDDSKSRKSTRRRTSSFASADSDASMATQELEDEELLGDGKTDTPKDNAATEGTANNVESEGLSPNGTGARRAISNLLFPNKKAASDNPYADPEDAEAASEQAQTDAQQPDVNGTTNARSWFKNSPINVKATRTSKKPGEDEDTPARRTWFSSTKQNGSEATTETPNPHEHSNGTDVPPPPASAPPASAPPPPPPPSNSRVPWLSSSAGAVQEDYGEDIAEMSHSSNQDAEPEDATPTASENPARRGWFQRRQAANTEEDGAETTTASTPSRFRLFKNRSNNTAAAPATPPPDENNTKKPDEPDSKEETHDAVAEFSNFLDVDSGEVTEEIIELEPVGEDEFSEFLDVDDNDESDTKKKPEEDEKENDNEGNVNNNQAKDKNNTDDSATEKLALTEEKRSRVGFGLFRRKKATANNSEDEKSEHREENETDKANGMGKDEDSKGGMSEKDQSVEKKSDDEKDDENPAKEEGEAEPTAAPATTSRFRIFARKGNDPATNGEPTDDVPGEQPQESQRTSYISSLWRKNPTAADDQKEVVDDAETNCKSIPEETEQQDSEEGATPVKASLLSRVFTPAKSKNVGDGDNGSDEPGDEVKAEATTPEEPTTRRFLRFSARKVADSSTSEASEQAQSGQAPENTKVSPRKFSLFGFGRSGTDATEENNGRDTSWASDEPPTHWATATTATFQSSKDTTEEGDGDENEESESKTTPLHYANHPFASVSRALEDNILALHAHGDKEEETAEGTEPAEAESDEPSEMEKPNLLQSSLSLIVSPDPPEAADENGDAALGEIRAAPAQESTLKKVANDTYEVASGTYQAVMATANAQKKMGVASVAGGIAGGVAGLMFAGPAGAVMGVRYGRTAGALGVILEGSLTVGVIVAGVAGGRYTAEKIQQQIEEQRVLTIGETGVARKVMLVRPTIRIDPVWNEICTEAQRTAPSSLSSFTIFSDSLKHDRYEKTDDICEEDEIPTEEKVLLLVSRVLSDKDSFPGHVYRSLMQAFRDRCEQRKELRVEYAKNQEDYPHLFDGTSFDSVDVDDSVNMGDGVKLSLSPRARREDAHGVIKYITATLLEVRPGLASTPEVTETTASVVEALVFGEVYDLVYEEIAIEATERDKKLLEKIDDFEFSCQERTGKPLQTEGVVSKEALDALRELPETHSAVDKLRHCVVFLEKLSDHFAHVSSNSAMGADSLLKMVCQHIIAAKMSYINAEVAFLEEFARDEQLLRGKEGYALVTLQASLHFLNMSNDFERDIFGQDNDEENVPLKSASENKDDAMEDQNDKGIAKGDADGADDNLEHMSASSHSADEKSITEEEAREEKKEDEAEPVAEEDLL